MAAKESVKRTIKHYTCRWDGKGEVKESFEALLKKSVFALNKEHAHIWRQREDTDSEDEVRVLAHICKEHDGEGVSFEFMTLEGTSNAFKAALDEKTGECDISKIKMKEADVKSGKTNLLMRGWSHVTVIGDQLAISHSKGRSCSDIASYVRWGMTQKKLRSRGGPIPVIEQGVDKATHDKLTNVESLELFPSKSARDVETPSSVCADSPMLAWLKRVIGYKFNADGDGEFVNATKLRNEGYAISIRIAPGKPDSATDKLRVLTEIAQLSEMIQGETESQWGYRIHTAKGVVESDMKRLSETVQVTTDKDGKPLCESIFSAQYGWLKKLIDDKVVSRHWVPLKCRAKKHS